MSKNLGSPVAHQKKMRRKDGGYQSFYLGVQIPHHNLRAFFPVNAQFLMRTQLGATAGAELSNSTDKRIGVY